MNKYIIILLALIPLISQSQGYIESAKELAEDANKKIDSNVSDINYDDIPNFQGEDVQEREYYNSGTSIEAEAVDQSVNDDTANYIINSHYNRPQITIDKNNDPLLKKEKIIEDQANSLTSTYEDCVNITNQSVNSTEARQCDLLKEKIVENKSCRKEISATCSNNGVNHSTFDKIVSVAIAGKGRAWLTMQVNMIDGTWSIQSPSDGDLFHGQSEAVDYDYYCKQNTTTVTIQNVTSWNRGLYHVGGERVDTSIITRVLQTPNCDNNFTAILQIEDTRKNLDNTSVILSNSFNFIFTVTAYCDLITKENYSCDEGVNLSNATLVSSQCVESGIREINGFNIHQDCWLTENEYQQNNYVTSDDSQCQLLREQGCGLISTDCTESEGNICIRETQTYSCNIFSENNVNICPSIISCPDGNCANEYQTQLDSTQDFQYAAAALAVASEISDQFDHSSLSVFNGNKKRCKVAVLGVADCCKDSGWGLDLSLSSCDTQEVELGYAREAESTHYVGSYCSQDSLAGCLERAHVYCTYPSKLARIVVEQGNIQLDRNYGTARNPICFGFTLDELNELNFNQMDLSEFYNDVYENAINNNTLNPEQLIQDLTDKFNKMNGGQE